MKNNLKVEAKLCFNKSMEICQEIGFKNFESAILNQIGYCLIDENDMDNAKDCFEKSLFSVQETRNKFLETGALTGFGILNVKYGHIDQALQYYVKAFQIITKINLGQHIADRFKDLREELIEAGIPESDLPLPKHWEKIYEKQ